MKNSFGPGKLVFKSRWFIAALASSSAIASAGPVTSPIATPTTTPIGHAQSISVGPSEKGEVLKCDRYKIYYIEPTAQFFTPPDPIEDHAESIFCSSHENLDEVRKKLRKMKPVRSRADLDSGRIKAVLQKDRRESLIFCSNGEITYRGKQYKIDRRIFEPAFISIRDEADRLRAEAVETEAELQRTRPKK